MRNFAVTAATILLLTSCASTRSDSGLGNATVDVPHPDVQIQQLSSMPVAARHVEGAIPVRYAVAVLNHAAHPITLKQISLQSMGYGAYNVTGSRPFKTVIEPEQTQVVDFWVPANVDNASLVGANGPVTIRVTAHFDSPKGQFQEIVVQQVNAATGVDGSRQ